MFASVLLGGCSAPASSTRAAAGDRDGASKITADHYPILSWELPPRSNQFADPQHGLASLAECGYTVAAFVRPELLPECRRLGLKAILGPVTDSRLKWRDMSDQQIDLAVRELVGTTADDDTVIGYFLMDEPGARDFPALGKAVAAVKRLAPGKLAYINLFPDYATLGAPDLSQLGTNSYDDYLERYVREVRPQFISYDNYRVQYSADLQDAALAASYFRNLLSVRRVALQHGLPFWNIVSSNQIRQTTPSPSPANLLLQAYTTLAAGAGGLTWYTYYSGGYQYSAVETSGARTVTWSYLRMTNEQAKVIGDVLRGLKSTGVFFSSPPPARGLPVLPGELIRAVTSPEPVMVGEFAGPGGEGYALVVNLSLQRSAKLKIAPATAAPIGQVSPVDGSLRPIERGNFLWLAAGQGALLRLK